MAFTTRDSQDREVRRLFNRAWLRVQIEELAGGVSELRLASKGKYVVAGSFLSDAERRELAAALRAALVH